GLDTDFEAMEQLARAAAAGLTEGALTALLEQQAQVLGPQVPCPDCGTPCVLHREPRTLHLPGGTLPQSEPVGHCPACRRDFFPPAAPAAPRYPRLPSRRLAADRPGRRPSGLLRRCRLRAGPGGPTDLPPARPHPGEGGR